MKCEAIANANIDDDIDVDTAQGRIELAKPCEEGRQDGCQVQVIQVIVIIINIVIVINILWGEPKCAKFTKYTKLPKCAKLPCAKLTLTIKVESDLSSNVAIVWHRWLLYTLTIKTDHPQKDYL